MRFKLDECVDVRLTRLFEDAGHDLEGLVKEVIPLLPKESPAGHLWVVAKNRIRIWPA
jgi:hypothetical protein